MPFDRSEAIERIARRLRTFDDTTLAELDRLTDESTYLAAEPSDEPAVEPLTDSPWAQVTDAIVIAPREEQRHTPEGTTVNMERRRLLAGGAVIGAAAMTGAYVLLGGEDEAARAESSRLASVIDLYRQLDGLNLDERLRSAIGLIAAAVAAARVAAEALETGIEVAGKALDVAEAAFIPIREGLGRLEVMIGRLGSAFDRLSAAVVERAEPVSDAIGGVFTEVLDRLPASMAAPLREGIEALRMLVDMVPSAVAAAQDELILPLRATWLPGDDDDFPGIREDLFIPLRERVIVPGRQVVTQLRTLETSWSEGFDPLESLLEERDVLRAQIAEIVA